MSPSPYQGEGWGEGVAIGAPSPSPGPLPQWGRGRTGRLPLFCLAKRPTAEGGVGGDEGKRQWDDGVSWADMIRCGPRMHAVLLKEIVDH